MKRAEGFKAVQRESTQVATVLRKALFSLRLTSSTSPVQGGLRKPPSSSGGLAWAIRPSSTRTYHLGTGKVTDRRNSTLRCYFRHCG
jgi:hypothetical protein